MNGIMHEIGGMLWALGCHVVAFAIAFGYLVVGFLCLAVVSLIASILLWVVKVLLKVTFGLAWFCIAFIPELFGADLGIRRYLFEPGLGSRLMKVFDWRSMFDALELFGSMFGGRGCCCWR